MIPRRALGPVLLALSLPAQDKPAAGGLTADQEQRLQKVVGEMIALVERHSGLAFARRPKVRAAKHEEWCRIIEREFGLENAGEVFKTSVTTLGLYLPATDEVVLSPLASAPLLQDIDADAPRHVREALAHQKATVAHELVHALQEQHFALPSQLARTDDADTDEILRLKTLIEGHAVLIEELIAEEMGLEDFMQRGPYSSVDPESMSYRTGHRYFLQVLRGGGMKAVHEALAKPPTWDALLELAKKLPPPGRDGGEPRAGGPAK